MKKIFKTFLTVAAFAAVAGVSSCTKVCDEGYEGDKCDVAIREKLLGTWRTTAENCTSGGPSTFDIAITTNSDITKVNIANLYGAGFTAVASIDENNAITIASQSFGTGNISGSGSISGGSLTLSYTVTSGGAADNCNGVVFTEL